MKNNETILLIVTIISISMIIIVGFLSHLSKSVKDKGVHFENNFEVHLTEGKIKSDFIFDCKDTKGNGPQPSEPKGEDKAEKSIKQKNENDELVPDAHSSSSNNL